MRRFTMILGAVLALAALAAAPASAQSTPPPLPSSNTGTATMKDLGQAVFSAVEKAAIEKFFGRSATSAEQVLIDAAKDAILGSGSSTSASTSDDDYDDDSGKKGKNKGAGKNKGKGQGKNKNKGLPPGLAKRQQLPPGLQNRLAKQGRLPPGLAKRDLPDDLQANLPPPQDGTDRIIAGNDVVLVDVATNAVLDILYDVVTGQGR